MDQNDRYAKRGVSSDKEDVHAAIKNIDKDTVEWYRANDLIQLIIGIDEKDNKNKTNKTNCFIS